MKKVIASLVPCLIAAAGFLLAGCATSHDTGAFVPVNTTVNDVENHEGIVLMDPRVQYSVTCSGIQEHVAPDGRLDVTAYIRNREGRRIQVQVNCLFKDNAGMPSEGVEAPFQNLILTENAQEPVHFISLNPNARRYTIRIREAR